jgi:hypothetical protein
MLSVLLPVLAVLAAASHAKAQYPGAPQQVSPYVLLNRGGAGAAVNYYGLIRPQQQLQAGLVQAQQALIDEQRFAGTQEALANLPVITGNYATYMNQGRYFQTRGGPFLGPRMAGLPGSYGTAGVLPGAYGAAGGLGGGLPGITGAGGGFLNPPAGIPTGQPSVRPGQ